MWIIDFGVMCIGRGRTVRDAIRVCEAICETRYGARIAVERMREMMVAICAKHGQECARHLKDLTDSSPRRELQNTHFRLGASDVP